MLNYMFDQNGFCSTGRCHDIADIFEPDSIMGSLIDINPAGIKQLEEAFEKLTPGSKFTATLSDGGTLEVEKPL